MINTNQLDLFNDSNEKQKIHGATKQALQGGVSGILAASINILGAAPLAMLFAAIPRKNMQGKIDGATILGFTPAEAELQGSMTLQQAWDNLNHFMRIQADRQIHDCLLRWRYNRKLNLARFVAGMVLHPDPDPNPNSYW